MRDRPLRSTLCCTVLPALLLTLAALPATAQEPRGEDWQPLESFDEAISVEVTNLEVWVTDRQGNPVEGLSAEDFVLTEDGEPVEITNFYSFGSEESGSWAETGAASSAPAPTALPLAEIDPENRLHLAILIDTWSLPIGERRRVFEGLRTLVQERLHPRDRVMVLVHDRSLALLQEPTADQGELLAALDRIERNAMTNVDLVNERRATYRGIVEAFDAPGMSWDTANTVADGSPCRFYWHSLEDLAVQYATSVFARARQSGSALATAGELLAGLPGRKVLLYAGSGLPQVAGTEMFQYLTELCPAFQPEIVKRYSQFDLTRVYDEVVRQANANGVTLYTVDGSLPRAGDDVSLPNSMGGMTQTSDSATGPGRQNNPGGMKFTPSASVLRSAELDDEAGLFYVANETGGRAILNAVDFASDFELLASELRTYYSLGFTPEHGGDGRLHRIDVKLAKGVGEGYRVRHRQSYRDKPYEQRMVEKIRGVAQFGTEANRMNVRVETGEATPAGAGWRVPIRLWVPLDEITLVAPDGGAGRTGRLRVMMAVSDAAGNLGPVRQKLVTVEVTDGDTAPSGESGEHLVEVDLDLPTASHVVAAGLRDELGGETTFLRHEIRLDTETMAGIGEE